jgi:hypothetical protein
MSPRKKKPALPPQAERSPLLSIPQSRTIHQYQINTTSEGGLSVQVPPSPARIFLIDNNNTVAMLHWAGPKKVITMKTHGTAKIHSGQYSAWESRCRIRYVGTSFTARSVLGHHMT